MLVCNLCFKEQESRHGKVLPIFLAYIDRSKPLSVRQLDNSYSNLFRLLCHPLSAPSQGDCLLTD